MDIKFTFENGGEYLAHYGKVGMRWRKGRKTPEGTASITANRQNKSTSISTAYYGTGLKKSEKELNRQKKNLAERIKNRRKNRDLKTRLETKANRKQFGFAKKKKNFDSKAGLTARYARKVAAANSNYSFAKSQRRNAKLMGYNKLHNKG